MYLSILGKPTDKDIERYPAVHLTGPHEWGPMTLMRDLPLILTLMSLGITPKGQYNSQYSG